MRSSYRSGRKTRWAQRSYPFLPVAALNLNQLVDNRGVCHLEAAPLASASAWIDFYQRYREERLETLEALFRDDTDTHKDG